MERINTKQDVEIVLKKLKVKKKHGIKTYKRIKSEIERIITDKRIEHLFETGSHNFSETSILSLNGSVYRPDKVITHSNGMGTLIDYKTGKESNLHEKQMIKYESLLLQLGYKKIDKYLIYLTTGNIKKL